MKNPSVQFEELLALFDHYRDLELPADPEEALIVRRQARRAIAVYLRRRGIRLDYHLGETVLKTTRIAR